MIKMDVVAVDFDETLYDNNSNICINVAQVNNLFENPNNFIVIYTARSYSCFEWIRQTLLKAECKFHAIVCEKIRADAYIDDKNNNDLLKGGNLRG